MPAKVRFLGLDVHAATVAVAVAEADGSVRRLGTIANRAAGPPIESAARGAADSGRADDVALRAPSRSAGGLADTSTQAGWQPGALRLSTAITRSIRQVALRTAKRG
jgi:hypothetical protein